MMPAVDDRAALDEFMRTCTPMSIWHVNADPERPVRYLEITTFPLMKSIGAWSIETAPDDA